MLVPVNIPSIYKDSRGNNVNLPKRMALATPDTAAAIYAIARDVEEEGAGGRLVLSDLFRSKEDQDKAHHDYASGRKSAYSPPSGRSLHEAGRAFDIDLSQIKMELWRFWQIAAAHGVVPIIGEPHAWKSEAWHFECRGSHAVFTSARDRALSAILDHGGEVPQFGENSYKAFMQTALVRLGGDPGPIDGKIGPRTKAAFQAVTGTMYVGLSDDYSRLRNLLTEKFPREYNKEG